MTYRATVAPAPLGLVALGLQLSIHESWEFWLRRLWVQSAVKWEHCGCGSLSKFETASCVLPISFNNFDLDNYLGSSYLI